MAHAYVSTDPAARTTEIAVMGARHPVGRPDPEAALWTATITEPYAPRTWMDAVEAALGAAGWHVLGGRWRRPDRDVPIMWARVAHTDGETATRGELRDRWRVTTLGQLPEGAVIGLHMDRDDRIMTAEAGADWHPAEHADRPGAAPPVGPWVLRARIAAGPRAVSGAIVEVGWHPDGQTAPVGRARLRTITGAARTPVWVVTPEPVGE
ncbi:hypothetical protein SAMN05421803_1518 [Nocardiopsis flavescens]|uniref:Uncharacterized protein n=1 Tax=Nocardiopsis flavescens TaxID=758803 RepID=A0A1M6WU55_9ACTN|nr:hypothetical protein [Nocardiopsis flavescens]SHK97320.1 hypothetical protein SAMN05421803_1518 [Nocardiopsis flavescens]